MNKITGRAYKNATIQLDGNGYENCTFESCTFVYSAAAPFELRGNHITGDDTNIVFAGNAMNTLIFMQALYRDFGDWGRQTILNTFQQIAPGLKKLN